jgi:hypothetical protein
MLDNATKSLIDFEIDILLNGIEEMIVMAVSEDMSPNDPCYEKELDDRWETAVKYLDKKIGDYR